MIFRSECHAKHSAISLSEAPSARTLASKDVEGCAKMTPLRQFRELSRVSPYMVF